MEAKRDRTGGLKRTAEGGREDVEHQEEQQQQQQEEEEDGQGEAGKAVGLATELLHMEIDVAEVLDIAGRAERRAMHQAHLQELNAKHAERLVLFERAEREAAERRWQQQMESQVAEQKATEARVWKCEEEAREHWAAVEASNRELNR